MTSFYTADGDDDSTTDSGLSTISVEDYDGTVTDYEMDDAFRDHTPETRDNITANVSQIEQIRTLSRLKKKKKKRRMGNEDFNCAMEMLATLTTKVPPEYIQIEKGSGFARQTRTKRAKISKPAVPNIAPVKVTQVHDSDTIRAINLQKQLVEKKKQAQEKQKQRIKLSC